MLRISQYLFQGYLRDLEAPQAGVRQSPWLQVYDPLVFPKGRPRVGDLQSWAKFGPPYSLLNVLAFTPSFLHWDSHNKGDSENQGSVIIQNKTTRLETLTALARAAGIQWLWVTAANDGEGEERLMR